VRTVDCRPTTTSRRPLAVHEDLIRNKQQVREEIETIVANISPDIWLEKVEFATEPALIELADDPTVIGKLRQMIDELVEQPDIRRFLDDRLAEVRTKFPADAHANEVIAEVRETAILGGPRN